MFIKSFVASIFETSKLIKRRQPLMHPIFIILQGHFDQIRSFPQLGQGEDFLKPVQLVNLNLCLQLIRLPQEGQ
jgi:hypothetical protein